MTVKITPDDLVLLGHGSYHGGAANFPLPADVALHLLQPVGVPLRVSLAQSLVKGQTVQTLWLMEGTKQLENLTALGFPHVHANGERVPELTLYPLGDQASAFQQIGAGIQVETVSEPTTLQKLLSRPSIQAAIERQRAKGQVLRVYWLACANQVGTSSQETKSVGG